jgi:hypothetical protein
VARLAPSFHFILQVQDAGLNFRLKMRLTLEFFDRVPPPLATAIDSQHESFTFVRFDQQVGNRRRRVVDHRRIAGGQDDGHVGMVAA